MVRIFFCPACVPARHSLFLIKSVPLRYLDSELLNVRVMVLEARVYANTQSNYITGDVVLMNNRIF